MEEILIVEDEPKLAALVADYLRAEAFGVHLIDDGLQVVPWVRENKTDLILLDLMLPGRDGLEICRELRSFTDVPVVMVTARVEEIDRLVGLEAGADDYVCKPFSLRELVARVKAILRRPRGAKRAAGLALDASRHVAELDGTALDLTPVEFRLLAMLAEAPGKVFSRGTLLERLYPDHRVVTDRTVDTHVKNLRKKIAEIRPSEDPIPSIYGVGYKLEL
ncbi:MAG TPA: response regulator [Burkholderiales bacterium]